ncbi:hypothetical protein QR680_000230 [Steinernema hermaphroditum]|uniref:Uncharacterized protein n=1 Tax=Steinernema hermaphroditum TaxID=289476 RepID=A0AA39GVX5_9BILA|nr:hypothetical protein QR680_000230 [Steinernema hermaphroditum]
MVCTNYQPTVTQRTTPFEKYEMQNFCDGFKFHRQLLEVDFQQMALLLREFGAPDRLTAKDVCRFEASDFPREFMLRIRDAAEQWLRSIGVNVMSYTRPPPGTPPTTVLDSYQRFCEAMQANSLSCPPYSATRLPCIQEGSDTEEDEEFTAAIERVEQEELKNIIEDK